MKQFLLVTLLSVSSHETLIDNLKTFTLEDKIGFSPIRQELPVRYDDLDICEIFHGKDLDEPKDHGTPDLGRTPTPDNK